MAVENVSINFSINNNVLNTTIRSLKSASQEVQKLQTKINSLSSSLRNLSNTRVNINGLNNLNNTTNRVTSGMSKAEKATLKLYTELYRVGKINLSHVPQKFREILKEEKSADIATAELYLKMLRLKRINYDEIPQQFRNLLRSMQQTRQEMSRADQEAGKLYQQLYRAGKVRLDQIPPELRDIATKANLAQRALQALSRISMASLSTSLMQVGQNMMMVGRMMNTYITQNIVKGLGACIKASMDFEQQLQNTGAVAGATAKEMAQLKEQALQLGIKTKFSALDVAKGQTELLKAGRDIKQVFAEMKDVLDLAAAGDISVAKASEYTANMLNMFTKEGIKAKDVANLFAGAANQSAIDATDFYNTMKYVGGNAANLNIPLSEVAGIVSILGNNAKKGTSAGQGLRNILARLQPASDKAEAAMKSLGLITEDGTNKFFDAKGEVKDFSLVIDILKDSFKGMTTKDISRNLDIIFGKVANPSVYALITKNGKALQEMGKRIMEISAADVAARKMDTFAGSVEFAKSSLETFAIKVGDSINPVLRILVKELSKVFETLGTLPKPVLGAVVVFATFIAAIGPCVLIMGLFSMAIGALITPIGLVTTAVGLLLGAGALGGLLALLSTYTGGGKGISKSLNEIKEKAMEIYAYLEKQWVPGIEYLLSGDNKSLGKVEDKDFRDSLKEARKSIETLSKTVSETVEMINKDVGQINSDKLNNFSKSIVDLITNLAKGVDVVLEVVQALKEAYDFIKELDLEFQLSAAKMNDAMPKFMQTENRGGKSTKDIEKELLEMRMSDTKSDVKEYERKVKVATTFEEKNNAQDELDKLNNKLKRQIKEYEKAGGKIDKKVKVDTKVETNLDGVYKSEKELKKAIEKELKGNKKIEIDGNLKDEKLKQKVDNHNLELQTKLKSGQISSVKSITFDANIQDINAKTKIDMSNQSLGERSRIKIPDVMKNWNTSANINDSGAKQSADNSNTQIKTKANEKIPDPTKNIKVSASVDNSSALTSVYNAMQGIITYATGFAMPVIKKGIQVISDVVTDKKSTKKHALGTRYSLGGMALVGEQGAELVNLPKGSQVYNNQQTRSIMNNNNQRSININYSGGTTTQDKNNFTNMLRAAGVY